MSRFILRILIGMSSAHQKSFENWKKKIASRRPRGTCLKAGDRVSDSPFIFLNCRHSRQHRKLAHTGFAHARGCTCVARCKKEENWHFAQNVTRDAGEYHQISLNADDSFEVVHQIKATAMKDLVIIGALTTPRGVFRLLPYLPVLPSFLPKYDHHKNHDIFQVRLEMKYAGNVCKEY